MKIPVRLILPAVAAHILISGCRPEYDTPRWKAGCAKLEKTYTDVPRIMMHEPGRYTIFVREEKSKALKEIQFPYYGVDKDTRFGYRADHYEMFIDVPEGEPSWVKVRSSWNPSDYGGGCEYTVEFHLHEKPELGGAGWEHTYTRGHGPYRRRYTERGTTTVIE